MCLVWIPFLAHNLSNMTNEVAEIGYMKHYQICKIEGNMKYKIVTHVSKLTPPAVLSEYHAHKIKVIQTNLSFSVSEGIGSMPTLRFLLQDQ